VSGVDDRGIAAMFKNIVFKADIDIRKGVVAMVERPNGTIEELKHCGDPDAIRAKKHKQLKPLDVKRKTDHTFAVEFICVGTHRQDFEPLSVFIVALRRGSSEKIRSKSFTLIGSRYSKRINAYKNAVPPTPQPVPPTTKNLTQSKSSPNISFTNEELLALLKPADPSNQAQAETFETQDYQNITTSTILDDNPYMDFMHSRFDN